MVPEEVGLPVARPSIHDSVAARARKCLAAARSKAPTRQSPKPKVSTQRQAIRSDFHLSHISLRAALELVLAVVFFVFSKSPVTTDDVDVPNRFKVWRWWVRGIVHNRF